MSILAKIITPNEIGISQCASALRAGKLVAFPTGKKKIALHNFCLYLYNNKIFILLETVYGLGANALNASAVLDIFKAKGRPLTGQL